MPANTIDLAFIKQFQAEVHVAYQRQGSKLRGSVRTKNNITGASTVFQRFGTGEATQKARNAVIPPMNPDHSTVECFLNDWYAGSWIDRLDEYKTNIDERQLLANAGAWALGRKTDSMIIAAMDSADSSRNVTGTGDLADTAGMTKAKALAGIQKLNEADVPDDGMRFAAVSPQGWTDLLNITEFSNTQYIGQSELPYGGMGLESKRWLGVMWMRYTGLGITSNVRRNFIWHPSAIGHAIGADVTTDITWHGDRAAHFVNNMMSQGSVLIDQEGVVRINTTEAAS